MLKRCCNKMKHLKKSLTNQGMMKMMIILVLEESMEMKEADRQQISMVISIRNISKNINLKLRNLIVSLSN